MRQYTTPEQTAKLIELGFEKPKGWCAEGISSLLHMYKHREDDEGFNYSIGELIEMLLPKPHCRVSIYNVGLKQHKVLFKKLINGKFKVLFREVGYEPIDLLFNCIVKLKEDKTL